jgi:hypothetical protein
MPPNVTLRIGLEPSLQKRVNQLLSERTTDNPAAQAKDVHVVVFNALVRRIGIVAERRVDSRDFVGGDAGPYPAAADDDAALSAPIQHLAGDSFRIIRIIFRIGRVIRAQINHLVSCRTEIFHQLSFEGITSMIRTDGYFHEITSRFHNLAAFVNPIITQARSKKPEKIQGS